LLEGNELEFLLIRVVGTYLERLIFTGVVSASKPPAPQPIMLLAVRIATEIEPMNRTTVFSRKRLKPFVEPTVLSTC
jgi:hypothetical protein